MGYNNIPTTDIGWCFVIIRVAICDDEKNLANDIKRMVINQCADCHVDLYDSGESLLAAFNEYDIYFLDIQMGSISGIDTAQRIRAREAKVSQGEGIIIFITSHTDYWKESFDVKAYHYLVKPIDKNKFNTVFARALADCSANKEKAARHIIVKSKDSYHKLLLSDIYYIESRDKKAVINAVNGTVEYYGKMRDLEASLGNAFYPGKAFFRCHRCYIVNMEHIVKYNATTIRLINGSEIFLSHRKYNDFVKAYLSYAKRGGLIHE